MSTAEKHRKRSHRSEHLHYYASVSRARIAVKKQSDWNGGFMGWLKQRMLRNQKRRGAKADAGND